MSCIDCADAAWLGRLAQVLATPDATCAPRGMPIYETFHATTVVDMTRSLVRVPSRGLNPRFAAAEALWILRGSDRLDELTPYNKRMAEFSDDGATLRGAYGPRLARQLHYIVNALRRDRDTRQAVASIWTPEPAPSRDVPCTIALTFMIRGDHLHAHAFMRSSDVWLGLPYDLFSFSAYAATVVALYNALAEGSAVSLGTLFLTAASSHLYETHREAAERVLAAAEPADDRRALPARATLDELADYLIDIREGGYDAAVA